MAYVITGTRTEDGHCIDTCPVNGIHSTTSIFNLEEPGGSVRICSKERRSL
jgi:hypothetical protein